MGKEIEQSLSKKARKEIDNLALQVMLMMISKAKMKEDDMLEIQLSKCPHCSKQRIFIKDVEEDVDEEESFEAEQCFYCENPVDTEIIIYQFKNKNNEQEQIICLKSEAEELVKK